MVPWVFPLGLMGKMAGVGLWCWVAMAVVVVVVLMVVVKGERAQCTSVGRREGSKMLNDVMRWGCYEGRGRSAKGRVRSKNHSVDLESGGGVLVKEKKDPW